MKKTGSILISVALAVTGFSVLFKYWYDRQIFYPSGLISDFPYNGEYKIDPSTILTNLQQGNIKVFEEVSELNSSNIVPLSYGSFLWSQTEYVMVIDAFHQFVWGESLNDWQIYEIAFNRGCQENATGFDAASILVYMRDIDNSTHYNVHFLGIYPLKGVVSWGEGKFNRPLLGWQNIDFDNLRVSADDALKIAEERGGKNFRLDVMNECVTSLSIKPNPRGNKNWLIYYNNITGTRSFSIGIDPR